LISCNFFFDCIGNLNIYELIVFYFILVVFLVV
jgi:hypothetical protein